MARATLLARHATRARGPATLAERGFRWPAGSHSPATGVAVALVGTTAAVRRSGSRFRKACALRRAGTDEPHRRVAMRTQHLLVASQEDVARTRDRASVSSSLGASPSDVPASRRG